MGLKKNSAYLFQLLRLVLTIFIILILSCKAYSAEKVTLQLLWKNQFQFAGYYIAKEKGYFEDLGLDVEIKEYSSGLDISNDILSGKVQFGVGRTSLINEMMNGKELFLVFSAYQYSPLILLSKQRDDIKRLKDLKNKKIMISNDAATIPSVNAMMISNGIRPGEYIFQNHSFNIDDLINEKTDAMASYISNEPYQLKQKGIPYTIFSPEEFGYNFYSDILYTSKAFNTKSPEIVDKFREASIKGWIYAFNHISETADLIYNKYNTQNRTKDALIFEGTELRKLAFVGNTPFGDISLNRIEQIAQIYLLLNLGGNPISFENTFYKPSKKKISKDLEIKLNEAEKRWLAENPKLRVANEINLYPYSYFDGNKSQGHSVDFMDIIAKKTGLEFTYISRVGISDFLDLARKKRIDIIPNILKTNQRDLYLNFTSSYMAFSPRIIYKNDKESLNTLSKLKNKKLAFVEGFNANNLIKKNFNDSELFYFKDTLDALFAVSRGDVDAAFCDFSTANYIINEHHISNLSISSRIELNDKDMFNLHLGVREDYTILTGILNKAIESISLEEFMQLKMKWFPSERNTLSKDSIEFNDLLIVPVIVLTLIMALVGVFVLFRTFSNKKLFYNFGSPKFRLVTLVSMIFIISIVGILLYSTLERNKKIALNSIENQLKLIVRTTNENNDLWIYNRLNFLSQLGRDPELVSITKRLLTVTPNQDILLKSEALLDARKFLAAREDEIGKIGFFIINPNYISIGSRRDSNLGSINIIAKHKPELLKDVFRGNARFIPPIISDVDIETNEVLETELSKRPFTMFFAAPIRDLDGTVIAVLTQRLLPDKELQRNAMLGQIGLTGETYFINSIGRMVTASRFKNNLIEIGLIDSYDSIIQGLDILDPGVNLMEGYKPKIERSEMAFTKMADNVLRLADKINNSESWVSHSGIVTDTSGYRDYRGVPVFGAWMWERHLGLGIASEIDVDEALAGYYTLRFYLLVITATIMLLSIIAVTAMLILGERATNVMLKTQKNLEDRVKERTSELREAREHFEHLLEAAPDGFIVVNSDGLIILVNDEAQNIFGLTEEDILNRKMNDLVENYEEERELYAKHSSGKKIPVEVHLSPLKTKQGTITIASISNISKRKEDEMELRKLSRTVEESPVVVLITDKEGTIEYVNKYFTYASGYTKEEVMGKNPRILKSGKYSKEFYRKLWNTILAGREWKGDFENRKKNGDLFWESVSISPLFDENFEIINFVAIKRDITERKMMEEELINQKERAEVATQAKSDFLANMSHEIRTPMNAILGMSHLALKTELNAKQHDYLTKIDSSAKSLLGIINDILDFSKIEAGKLTIETIEFNLSHVLSNLSNIIANKVRDKKLELIFDISPDVPRHLKGDPLRLGQILLNLANNAIKFTEEGEVIISINVVKKYTKSILLSFAVKDTGIGLSKDEQNRLFQSFQQADVSTTRKYGGTGLGLAISKKLVKAMKGTIGVESEKGVGSTFSFTLELGVNQNFNYENIDLTSSIENLKIMIIDDNQSFKDIMQKTLQSFNYVTETVSSCGEAVKKMKRLKEINEKAFDLLILKSNILMNNRGEVFNLINDFLELDEIPKIIVTSKYGEEKIHSKIEKMNISKFLMKPITPSEIFDAIMEIFSQNNLGKISLKKELNIEPEGFDNIRGANILLVEDNEVNQQFAVELLESEGFFVTIADNGSLALEQIFKSDDLAVSDSNVGNFDIILMDLQMPVMDGYTATKLIREHYKPDTLPIIAMTADAMSGVEEKVTKIGMNDYISKPINPRELFEKLCKWITEKVRDLPENYINSIDEIKLSNEANNNVNKMKINELTGFDTKRAIERIGGNEKAYFKTLKKVLETEEDAMERFSKSLNKGEFDTAIRIIHTLKGVAGNIGAMELHKIALDLETNMKENSNRAEDNLINEVRGKLSETMNIIRKSLLTEASTKINKEINLDIAKELLEKLIIQIDNFDSFAAETCEELILNLKGTHYEHIAVELLKALEEYNFDKAENLLRKIDLT